MRWDAIQDSLQQLPDHVVAAMQLKRLESRPSSYDWDIERQVLAYSDLEFGWKMARACAAHQLPLPAAASGEDEMLFRAWCYHINPGTYKDKAITQAVAWQTDPRFAATVRTDLQALLLARDATVASASQAINLPYDSVMAYQTLFWNVMDRKADVAWLKQFVYPETRMVEFFADYIEQPSFRELLLRAGYNHGIDHVRYLSGISNDPVTALGASAAGQQFESFVMANAMLMAQGGWLNNTKHATAIFHARHLMTATKLGGDSGGEAPLLSSLSGTVMDELVRIKRPQAEEALRLTLEDQTFGRRGTVIVDAETEVTENTGK